MKRMLVAGVLVACAAGASAQVAAPPAVAASVPAPSAQPLPAHDWTPAQAQAAFRRADADGDGVLSRAEAQRLAILPRSFEDMDANHDGVLDLNEYLQAFPH